MTKILIVDHYPLNKGVAAILSATLSSLRKEIPNAETTVLSYNPEYTHCEARVLNWLIKKESPLKTIRGVFLVLLYCLFWHTSKNLAAAMIRGTDPEKGEILREYKQSDIIVCAGGTLDVSAGTTFGGVFAQMPHICSILICRLMDKPVMVYSYSVVPLKNLGLREMMLRFLVRFAWSGISIITLRDESSKNSALGLGIDRSRICVTADPAILLEPANAQRISDMSLREGIDISKPLVAMTVVDYHTDYSLKYHYHGSSSPAANHDEYKTALAVVADYLVEKLGATVVFLPMEMNIPGNPIPDRPIIMEITRKIKHGESVKVIGEEYSPEELMGFLGQMDLLIATRMHSIILAAGASVPTIGIAYEPKVDEFMRRIGQEEWVCSLLGITAEDIIKKTQKLWAVRDDVKRNMLTKVRLLQEEALMNAKFAKYLLSGESARCSQVDMKS